MAEERHGGFSDTHPSDGHRLTEAFNSTVEISHKGFAESRQGRRLLQDRVGY